MNSKFIISTLVILIVISATSFYYLENSNYFKILEKKDFIFDPLYFPGNIAEAYQSSSIPITDICNPEQIQETKTITGTDFKTLKILPQKYNLHRVVDLDPERGWLQMSYTYGDCNSSGPSDPYKGGLRVNALKVSPSLKNDTLSAITGLEGDLKTEMLSKLRTEQFENRTQTKWTENERFTTINGHLAVIDEPGYTTDRYWDYDTGKLLYKEAVTHPGKISFVDKDFEIYYSITGYFGANELILMAESID